jgi:multiple sugar transport system substrate-binding protein
MTIVFGMIMMAMLLSTTVITGYSTVQKEVTLKATVAEPADRWITLFGTALERMKERHPEQSIGLNFTVIPYYDLQQRILASDNITNSNLTNVGLFSVDQPWLGALVEKGLLENLTRYTSDWNRSSDWNENNWKGGIYNDDVYGIWAWTDVRALWYWKDLLNQSGIEPDSLKTWGGYLNAAKKLNASLPNGTEPAHLVAASHSPDMWYPYLWMLGGDILEQRSGHPTRGVEWFPAYNSSAGVKALTFIKDQIEAGIKPEKSHYWGQEFADKKFAMMLEGSWLPAAFRGIINDTDAFEQQIGMLPMFPVPDGVNQSATMMGGWLLGMSSQTENKDLTWKLIATMLEPDVMLGMLNQTGYLPTQKAMMNGTYFTSLNESIPYFSELISMVPIGHTRPNIPQYPHIADHIGIALKEVFDGTKEPQEALDDAAFKTAKLLGW